MTIRTRALQKFKAGTTLYIRIEVRDATDLTHPLFTPGSNPQILIRDPAGTVAINYASMTQVDTGHYSYTYQTTTAGPIGVWSVGFKVVNVSLTVYTPERDGFELVP